VNDEIFLLVDRAAREARRAAGHMARATDDQIAAALGHIASRLTAEAAAILAANKEDLEGAQRTLSAGGLDRLRLDEIRLAGIARQVRALAALAPLERVVARRTLDNGLQLEERRVPVGVIGANYEARPNVTIDFATQLIKSRNAGVLRTGGAQVRSTLAKAVPRGFGQSYIGAMPGPAKNWSLPMSCVSTALRNVRSSISACAPRGLGQS